jgi:hypothetical protein
MTDLFGLRLAGQVLGHKAALAGRPRVARWFADFESVVAAELARRGVGVVLTSTEPSLGCSDADAGDRRLLGEYLGCWPLTRACRRRSACFCRELIAGMAGEGPRPAPGRPARAARAHQAAAVHGRRRRRGDGGASCSPAAVLILGFAAMIALGTWC